MSEESWENKYKEERNPLAPQTSQEDEEDLLSEIDIAKLLVIAQKSLVWIALLFTICFTGAFLFNRYSKPVFQSSSTLKLDLKSDAKILGFDNFSENGPGQGSKLSTLSGEIELIKSRLIYEKLIERMNLKVSCYTNGKILHDEKYKESPFEVLDYKIKTANFYDTPIGITLTSREGYVLKYKVGDKEIQKKYKFGDKVDEEYFSFRVLSTNYFVDDYLSLPMFFIIHSDQGLLDYLMTNVTVEILNLDANTIKISFKDHNALKAADIVNNIDTVYLQQTIETKSKAHEQTINFLEATLRQTDDSLTGSEELLEAFVKTNKTVDVKSDFAKVTAKIEELEKAKMDLNIKISLLSDLTDVIYANKDLKVILPSLYQIPDPQLASSINSLNQLQQQRESLISRYERTTYAVKSIDTTIGSLKKSIFDLINQNKKLLYKEANELTLQTKELRINILSLPRKETELTRLKRFYGIYEKFYLLLMEKQTEFGIAKAGTIPNFVVLSPGLVTNYPIYPNKMVLYLIASGLALFLSIVLIFFRYFLHDNISTQKELERGLTAPMVGGVPMYTKEKMDTSMLIVDKSPKSAISESLRSIRTNLEFICPNKKKRLISVTSTVSGEGKTFIAVNLGAVISMSGQKVIVLDLDMRKPKVHYAFNKENIKGMSTILIGKHTLEECVNQSTLENLFFITAGPIPPNPSELILNPEFDRIIEQLFLTYDVVVVDTPPVGLVTDGVLIMNKADLPLYVVRANYSKKGVKKNINKLIKVNRIKKLSVILNALKAINTYGYGGYGYDYGYGYYDGDKSKSSIWKRIFSIGK